MFAWNSRFSLHTRKNLSSLNKILLHTWYFTVNWSNQQEQHPEMIFKNHDAQTECRKLFLRSTLLTENVFPSEILSIKIIISCSSTTMQDWAWQKVVKVHVYAIHEAMELFNPSDYTRIHESLHRIIFVIRMRKLINENFRCELYDDLNFNNNLP